MDGTACVGGPGTDEQHVIDCDHDGDDGDDHLDDHLDDNDHLLNGDNMQVCGMCGILYDSSYPIGAHAFDQQA